MNIGSIDVHAAQPALIAMALGDPRDHKTIDRKELQKGDCAVLAIEEGHFGAVYFLRPKPDDKLESAGGQEVLGVILLLGARATNDFGRRGIQSIAQERGFKVEVHNGRDMDGVWDQFHIYT